MGPLCPFSSDLGCLHFRPGLLLPRAVLCDLGHQDVPGLCGKCPGLCGKCPVLCDVHPMYQGCHRVSGVHFQYFLHIFFWPFW